MTTLSNSQSDKSLASIFDLLEREGLVSYELLAQTLGTSRMTAYRTAAKLISQNKLCERHGIDPRTRRHMKLLYLSPMPPCLILDMQPSPCEMSAFYAKGAHIHTLSCDYHTTYGDSDGVALNTEKLLDTVALLWPDAMQAPHLIWGSQEQRANIQSPCMPSLVKQQALTYALTHHPHLQEKTSILFLHLGELPYGTYIGRTSTDDVWQTPVQDYALTKNLQLLGWQRYVPEKDKRALIAKYLNHIQRMGLLPQQPQLLIWEENMTTSNKISQSDLRFEMFAKGEPSSVYKHTSPTPWWIYGGFWQYRREKFLAPVQISVQEKEPEMQK